MELELKGLLDQDGGINKGVNTPNAFLKLFAKMVCLESNRNLSILLEVVLKTNNKATLHHMFMSKAPITGLHILIAMLWSFQSNRLLIAILRKGLRVLQHLTKQGVVEGKKLTHCTRHICLHMIPKLLFHLTRHGDEQVRAMASTFQNFRFEMPRQAHSTHESICEVAKKKAERKRIQDEEGLEEGEIPVDEE